MPKPKQKPVQGRNPVEETDAAPEISENSGTGSSNSTTYESRISVLEAWQYPGSVAQAPPFIDRNWIGYHTGDEHHPAQPCLYIPSPTRPGGVAIVYVGDYVVRQLTTLIDGLDPDETVEVWPKDDFERLFIPKNQRKTADDGPALPSAPAPTGGADRQDVDAGEAPDAAA